MNSRENFLQQYRKNLLFSNEELRQEAASIGVSVLSDEVGEFISFYLRGKEINEIVEIGSGVAYSTTLLHLLFPKANLVSLERYEPRYEMAKKNLVSEQVSFLLEDGEDYLRRRKKAIDLLFLDGSKPHYIHFLELALPMMEKGALLIADNIFGRGLSYEKNIDRRHKTLQKRMSAFLELVFEEFHATLLPLDDGLLIAERK